MILTPHIRSPKYARMASPWYPSARITRSKPCRCSCFRSNSRKGRPAISAIDFGEFAWTLRRRVPAPPQRITASGVSGIDEGPFVHQRVAVDFFRLVYHHVAALIREAERD